MARGFKPSQDNNGIKAPANRAVWQEKEDQIMIGVLVDEKHAGNQSGAGWKKQVWTTVASALEKAVQDKEVELRGPPKDAGKCSEHWQHLKKSFNQVHFIRNCSGMGWDDTRKICMATNLVWTDLEKRSVTRARFWQENPFPFYNELHSLVLGTVATGAGAFHPGKTPVTSPFVPSESFSDSADENVATVKEDPARAATQDTQSIIDDELSNEIIHLETPTPKTPVSRKRIRASSEISPSQPSSSTIRKKNKIKAEGSNDKMSNALHEIAMAMSGTPARREKAIAMMYADGDFSDNEETEILHMFANNKSIADTYRCINVQQKRTKYLRSLLTK